MRPGRISGENSNDVYVAGSLSGQYDCMLCGKRVYSICIAKEPFMIEDYENARKLGIKTLKRNKARGKNPYPEALENILGEDRNANTMNLGIVEIPLSEIAGTRAVERQNAFASDFMPILDPGTEFAMKWSNLYDSAADEGIRDQIKVYEYKRKFYVQEGNKRVSVSKYLGITDILASITRVMPKRRNNPESRKYYEFVDFYNVCPLYDIKFTKEGGYEQLARDLGMDLDHIWPEDKVRELRFSYHIFRRLFRENGGDSLEIECGDAFLIYLNFYGTESLMHEPESVIEAQVRKVWNEILLAASGDTIDLLDTPESVPKQGGNLITNLFSPMQTRVYTVREPLRVSFIYAKTPETSRWTYAHELGRQSLADSFHGAVDAIKFENCSTDEQIRKAIDASGADEDAVIFTTSPLQMKETLKSAIHYPDIRFMNCSINQSHNAVMTYYARMCEAKFLMGALAAMYAENHRIAYRANYPIYTSIANINAFAIGAAVVDPKVKIYLSWGASEPSGHWEEKFFDQGIRTFSGANVIQPDQPSRAYGIYLLDGDGEITNLAVPYVNWGRYYYLILRPIVEGEQPVKLQLKKDQAVNCWWGMSGGVVDVILGNKVSYYSRKLIRKLKGIIMSGQLDVFGGELHSQSGLVKGENTPGLSNEEIITMNWLNDNVVGKIPAFDDLTESGKEAVRVSGILEN